MVKFKVYKYEFELDGEKYELYPLTGEDISLYYECASSLPSKEGEDVDMSKINFSKWGELILKVFKKSYPNEDEKELEGFVGQNIPALIGPVVNVHLPISQRTKL